MFADTYTQSTKSIIHAAVVVLRMQGFIANKVADIISCG